MKNKMKLNLAKTLNENFGIKIFVSFTLLIFIISFSFTSFYIRHQSKSMKDTLIKNGRLLSRILACNSRIGVFSENDELLKSSIEGIFQQEGVLEVSVFNLEGELLKKQERSGIKTREKSVKGGVRSRNKIFEKLKDSGNPLYLEGNSKVGFWAPVLSGSDYFMGESLFFEEVPLQRKERIIGFIGITVGKEILNKGLDDILFKSTLIGIIFLIIGSGVTYLVVKGITKPLNRLTEGVKALGMRGVSEKIPVETGDEIGKLAKAFNDMSESLKTREELLRKSEEQYRVSIESAPYGIVVYDQDEKILIFNPQIEKITGYSKEEILNVQTWIVEDHPDQEYRRSVTEERKTITPQEFSSTRETVIRRKDGEKRICNFVSSLLPSGFRAVFINDITYRKQADEEKVKLKAQLQQSQKMEAIGTLAGGVAHDFNNLLTVIIGNADLALMNIEEDTDICKNLTEIRNTGERAASLTRQLLAFSRKQIIQPAILNLNELLDNLKKMLKRLIGEDIDLKTVCGPDLYKIEADPGQMEQVIINLAVNARDAMPKGGRLIIETANRALDTDYFRDHGIENRPGPYVMLAITDTGIGMDRETRSRIFEPFFTTKGMGKGTGLGLSTVYGIVKQNNGQIWVFSEPERGSTFKVYFPKAQKEKEAIKKDKSPESSFKGAETILVVEDDESLRNMTERMLKAYGYKILTASNGEEAIAKASSHKGTIYLLLTDVVMPGMGGKGVARMLQQIHPQIKIIYMSGYTDNAIVHHGVLEKGLNFIQKPFSKKDLARKVRKVLDGL